MDDATRRMKEESSETDAETSARTREIRQEIDETRNELTDTLDAIQDRLNPRTVMAHATDRVKSAATERVRNMADSASETAREAMDYTRDTAGTVADTVRENAIPFALIGIGAGWLIASQRRQSSPGGVGYSEESYAGDYRRDYSPGPYDTASGEAERKRWPQNVRRIARRRQTQLQRAVRENPVLIGAGAMMLGLACGLAVPETEAENEWMGDARESVVERARGMARAAANEVQEAAETVADTTRTLSGKGERS